MDDVLEAMGGMIVWNLRFLRHFQDWEMDNVKKFLQRL